MRIATVVISARAAAPWIEQCLDAVAGQRLPRGWRLRILLGVDACEETATVARRIALPNLSVLYFPDHVGPYVIFNSLACSNSSDAFIRFDADDVMLDGYLHSQLKALEPPISATFTQTWSIYVDPQLRPLAAPLADGSITATDGKRSCASHGQFLFTGSVWKRLGAFKPWWCHADTEFVHRARFSGAAQIIVPEYRYLRRVHDRSLTAASSTGYGSDMRRHYARCVADASDRYSRGVPPEWVHPMISRSVSLR